jgi:hypothetical protein
MNLKILLIQKNQFILLKVYLIKDQLLYSFNMHLNVRRKDQLKIFINKNQQSIN